MVEVDETFSLRAPFEGFVVGRVASWEFTWTPEIQMELSSVLPYVQCGILFGLYRLACARERIYPYVLRAGLQVLLLVVWMSSPVGRTAQRVFKRIWRAAERPVDCVHDCGPPTKFGYFRWNGKDFVRHSDSTISRVKLTGGTTTVDAEGNEATASRWEILEPAKPADLSPGESALAGLSSNARPTSLDKGEVLVYDTNMNHFSSGIVVDNILVMCRHKTAGLSHIVVKGTNTTVGPSRQAGVRIGLDRAHYLDAHGAPQWNEKKHTCTLLDFLAIPLQKDEISMIGVKVFKEKDLSRNYELQRGTITYSNDDFGSVVQEEGSIPEGDVKIHNVGLALAYIVSQPGASSSGVGVVQNGRKLAGMWLGQPAHSLKKHKGHKNLFMHTDALVANLEQVGLMKSPLLERIRQWGDSLTVTAPGESRESKKERAARRWAEYYQAMEDESESEYDDEEEQMELIHGGAGAYCSDGHARRPKAQPMVVLPPAVAAPLAPSPGESLGPQALDIVLKHNRVDLDTKVKAWKHGILSEDAPSVLRSISYFVEEASDDVRERLSAVLAVPSNTLLRDYMQKVAPEWDQGADGETIPDRNGDVYFRRIGTYTHQRAGKEKKKKDGESELQEKLRALATRYFEGKAHGCTKGEYKIPTCSKKNIDRSLRAQARLATASAPQLNQEQRDAFDAAVQTVRQKYSDGLGGNSVKSYLEEGEFGFLKTFLGYEDKSSGVSARYRNMKKSAWVKAYPEEVVDLALSRLILIAVAGAQLGELDAIDLVKYGCADVKDIFMKPEGHSPAKTEEGRFRLIWISSLVDLTVQAMLHKADNAAHVEAYQSGRLTCAALGMGHSPDGLRQLVRAFDREGVAGVNVSSDASAFDLSIDGSFIHSDGDRRRTNCIDPDVGRLVKRYAHVLCSHVLNNNGDVWLCEKYGVTSSGQLSTTTQNTYARSIMAAYGGCEGWVCAGDDLVGDENFDAAHLLDFGVRSRDVERHVREADFTSHLIDTATATAVFGNVEKLLWHLYDTCTDISTNRERFGSVLYILRDTPGVLEDVRAITNEFKIETEGYVAESSLANDMA
jgi:hypothetical protein